MLTLAFLTDDYVLPKPIEDCCLIAKVHISRIHFNHLLSALLPPLLPVVNQFLRIPRF